MKHFRAPAALALHGAAALAWPVAAFAQPTPVDAPVTTDMRVRYQVNKQWSAAAGIDNLNNYQYWNFHPYLQRTFMAELNFSL